jgi:ligand-binding sensor domain-containing protein
LPLGGKVQALAQTRDGSLWAGVYNQGLAEVALENGSTTWYREPPGRDSMSFDIINDILGEKDRLWLASNGGIRVLDQSRSGLPRLPIPPEAQKLPDEVITSILVDQSGSHWIGTYRSGVIRRSPRYRAGDPETRFQADQNNPHALPSNFIYFVQEDREGRVWIGTNGGLAKYRPETGDFQVWNYQLDNPRSLPGNSVHGFLEDSRGRLWVAITGGGLSRLDPNTGTVESYGVADGLSSLSIYSVLEDDSGLLWISSAAGLFSFRPETKVFRYFGRADGLTATEFSYGAVKTNEGLLAFGGIDGVVILDPHQLVADRTPPLVAITEIQVLGQSRPTAEIGLARKQRDLQLRRPGLSQSLQELVRVPPRRLRPGMDSVRNSARSHLHESLARQLPVPFQGFQPRRNLDRGRPNHQR